MEFTLADLLRAFAFSVILGFSLAVFYEPIRLFHKFGFNKSIHYFICDFLFMIAFAVITYLFCIVYIEGTVRLFVVLGELIGFLAFYFTLRPVLNFIYNPIIKFLKKFSLKLLKCVRKVMYNIKDVYITRFKSKVSEYVWKKKEKRRES